MTFDSDVFKEWYGSENELEIRTSSESEGEQGPGTSSESEDEQGPGTSSKIVSIVLF